MNSQQYSMNLSGGKFSPIKANQTEPLSFFYNEVQIMPVDSHPNGGGKFCCPHCDLRQQSSAALRNHIRVHTGERPFKCEMCDKSFKMPHHLQDHYRTHTGEKPFCCVYCDKQFVQRSNLRQHEQTVHYSEKHFPCPRCTERFSKKSELLQHQLVHMQTEVFKAAKSTESTTSAEPKIARYACRYCKLRFHRKDSLNVHVRLHLFNKETVQNTTEPELVIVPGVGHKRLEIEKSPISVQKFVLNNKLKREEAEHLEESTISKAYKCRYCSRTFGRVSALKAHANRMHANNNGQDAISYICSVRNCQKTFQTEASLRIHGRTHNSMDKVQSKPQPQRPQQQHPTPLILQKNQTSRIQTVPKPYIQPKIVKTSAEITNTRVQEAEFEVQEPIIQNSNSVHRYTVVVPKRPSITCPFCYDGYSRIIGNARIPCGHCKRLPQENSLKVVKFELDNSPGVLKFEASDDNNFEESLDSRTSSGGYTNKPSETSKASDQDLILGI